MNLCNFSVVVSVDVELNESSVDDVIDTEDRIVSQWRQRTADEKSETRDPVDEILRPLGSETKLVLVERANSIALFFVCKTLSALTGLRDQWCSGQLGNIVQSLFTFLSRSARPVLAKRLSWLLADYERSLKFFGSVKGK